MLSHPTAERLIALGLTGMAKALDEQRRQPGSTIVTSQLPVDQWHQVIGNPIIADAILDRLVHNAHRAHPQRRQHAKDCSKTIRT